MEKIISKAFNNYYDGGVKQGCKLAPTLFGIYAAILLQLSFNNINSSHSVKVWFRYNGNLFDLRRLKARYKVKYMYIQEAQYADDKALFSNSAEDLQDFLSAYNHVSKEMGLQINTSKTETMSIGTQVVFEVNNVKLPRVDCFKYLGSYQFPETVWWMRKSMQEYKVPPAPLAVLEKSCLTVENWQLKPKLKCTTNV